MVRSGSFSGLGGLPGMTLDPFGTSRGGFGRYALGSAMDAIDAMEKYAAQVGWANGTVSDADYLDQLRQSMERTPEGTRERIAAEDAYEDAVYTIGRNRLVRNINNANDDAERITAYEALISYDRQKLDDMVPGNEQRRELVDRIANAEDDIRTVRRNAIVRRIDAAFTDNARIEAIRDLIAVDQATLAAGRGNAEDLRASIADGIENIRNIERNDIVERINAAPTDQARINLQRELMQFDQATLERQIGDRDELLGRIASSRVDIRALRWNEMVRAYNQHDATNQSMLDFAKQAKQDAQGQPDQQQWSDRVFEFAERIKDEHLEQLRQDYDHDRVNGATVLAFIDQRMSEIDRNTPRWNDLKQYREDFARASQADEAAEKYALKYSAYQEGRLGDDEWLQFLHQRARNAPDGSEEKRAAKHDLLMETFRVGENKIIYDINVNNAPVRDLIQFYKTAQRGMDHDSARWMDLESKINRLRTDGVNAIDLGGSGADPDSTGPGHVVGGNPPGNNGNGPPSGQGGGGVEAVIAAARDLLGTPYVLGRESRNAIDCSGLIYRAFEDAGLGELIEGKRKRARGYQWQGQNAEQSFTDRSDLQRGDFVFYNPSGNPNRPATHMGIYLGNGKVISAVQGEGVIIHSINGINVKVTGFRRPDYSGTNPVGNGPSRPPGGTPPRDRPNGAGAGAGARPQPQSVGSASQVEPEEPDDTEEPATLRPGEQGTGRRRRRNVNQDHAEKANLPGAMVDMSVELLRQLGVRDPSDEQIRVAGTWLTAENGQTVTNNNPFNLITGVGTGRGNWLPGQIGVDGSGYAIFSTWKQGIAAAAREISQSYPTIAAGLRGNNPESALTAIERSNWRDGGYGNTLVPTYNSSGPRQPVINGTPVFDAPQTFADLADKAPGVTELFEIDPTDDQQWAWFQANFAALERAESLGNTNRWTFTTLNGRRVDLPFSHSMYLDILRTRAAFKEIAVVGGVNRGSASEDYESLRSTTADLSIEDVKNELKAGNREAQALIADGDWVGALARRAQMLKAVGDLLGIDPTRQEIDVDNYRQPTPGQNFASLNDAELESIRALVDAVQPYHPTERPGGDKLLAMLDDTDMFPVPGGKPAIIADPRTGKLSLNPEAAYVIQHKGTGELGLVTWASNPDHFVQEPVLDPRTGREPLTPRYLTDTVAIDLGVGVEVRFVKEEGTVSVGYLDLAGYREPSTGIRPNRFGPLQGTVEPTAINPTDMRSFWFGQPPPGSAAPGENKPASLPGENYTITRSLRGAPVEMITYVDPITNQNFQAYSIDGGRTWALTLVGSDLTAPQIVFDPATENARVTRENGLEIKDDEGKWHAYAPSDGPLAALGFTWFGTDERHGPTGARGAPDRWLPIIQANPDGSFKGKVKPVDVFLMTLPAARTREKTILNANQAWWATPEGAAWREPLMRGRDDGLMGALAQDRSAPTSPPGAWAPSTVTSALPSQVQWVLPGTTPSAQTMTAAAITAAARAAALRLSGSTIASNTRAVATVARNPVVAVTAPPVTVAADRVTRTTPTTVLSRIAPPPPPPPVVTGRDNGLMGRRTVSPPAPPPPPPVVVRRPTPKPTPKPRGELEFE